jgi:hypothetical protein
MGFPMSLLQLMKRRGARMALPFIVVMSLALAPEGAAAADQALEYQVKGAFLSKFGLYMDWSDAAANAANRPFQLCILGDDPFGPRLEKIVGEQVIKGRKIELRRLKTVDKESGCHILYIAASESARVGQILASMQGSGALTVTDGLPAGGPVGIVNFILKDDRVRFDIDDEMASRNGIYINASLLGLALNVKRRQSDEAH